MEFTTNLGWSSVHRLLVLFVFLLPLASCHSPIASNQNDSRIVAVATVGMVAELVRNIGGEHVRVVQVMGSGVDPHLYKATRDDVAIVLSGDCVFYSGLMLEGKMSDTLQKLASRQKVVAVTDAIDRPNLLKVHSDGEEYDPHVWMDVRLWSQAGKAVVETLTAIDIQHADSYQANFRSYQSELAKLDEYCKATIASVPQESRILITSHDAFSYMGRAYGLEVVGVQGLSTESEAGLQQINQLVDMIVQREVKAVFVESSVSRKNITALIDGANARGHQIIVGAELYSDAMGKAGTYEGTYVGMIDHNVTNLVRSLGGQAPQGGLNGKLSEKASHE